MNQLFSFFGRTGRGGFWLGLLCTLLVMAIFAGVAYLVFGSPISAFDAQGNPLPMGTPSGPDTKVVLNPASLGVMAIGYVLAIWIGLAAQVKRCHDRGFSGWWLLLGLIPLAGAIWQLVSLGILEGQEGPNVYGPDPRGPVKA